MSIAAGPGCCGDRFKTCKPQFGQHVVGHIRQAGVIGGQRATSTRRGLDYPGALIDTILPTGPQRPLRWALISGSDRRRFPHRTALFKGRARRSCVFDHCPRAKNNKPADHNGEGEQGEMWHGSWIKTFFF
jgi:hypothetical protein